MSDSVALVLVERVAKRVNPHVAVSEKLINHIATTKGVTRGEAKALIIASASKKALKLAQGDEGVAVTALTIVSGRANRLPQCVKLLRKHPAEVVKAAYSIKSELAISDTPLRLLCDLVQHTDGDMEGEASQLLGLLEEISMRALSHRHQWYLYERIREGLEKGHLIEALIGELRTEMDQFTLDVEEAKQAQSAAYHMGGYPGRVYE